MPRLYCERHGREDEGRVSGNAAMYRSEDEIVLVIAGRLSSGPYLCDRCNARLGRGDSAWLVSAFPSHCRNDLYDYDFSYERGYFAMDAGDVATAYGADWPDDSIRRRRIGKVSKRYNEPLCAMDLFKTK